MNAYFDSTSILGLFFLCMVGLLLGCSQPLTDSMTLSAEETQRAIVGYEETHYSYPVREPDSNRIVYIVVPEPLNYEPTYADYLKWKAGESMSRSAPPPEPSHQQG